ncbi:MAG: CapA family protein, partial [Chloroflexota bacterium]
MVAKEQNLVSFLAVGDICVNREKPESIFALTASVLNEPDIAFCQLETMYSERGLPALAATSAMRAHPRNVAGLKHAGFDVVSLAGNHALDWGDDALLDTIELLEKNNMRVVGAGKDITEARKPVILERKGIRIGFLAYNSILPYRYWADTGKPGCAPIRVSTHYEPVEHEQPGGPAQVLTFANKEDVEAMVSDIQNL